MLNVLLIWFGKLLGALLRMSGRHGAALPGLIIERLRPSFLPSMLSKLPDGVVIVSGTNGKTTTTKMITELAEAQGKRVLTNKTGGNFVRGVVSTLAQRAGFFGGLPYDVAVFEQDEAYAVKFVELFRPQMCVLLNVTRDQLDRFGEIDATAKLLQKVAAQTREVVVLNGDDVRLNKLKVKQAVYFGIANDLAKQFPNDEQLYGAANLDLKPHNREVELKSIKDNRASYKIESKRYSVQLQIDGQHNALNAAAALAAARKLYPYVPDEQWVSALGQIKAAFGRGEIIDYQGKKLILQLIKNPASFRQALHVLDIHKPKAIGILINDNYADGRDVSWLWDVEFQALSSLPIATGGSRGADMANRLKYDEIKTKAVENSLHGLVEKVINLTPNGQSAIIFTTYTAMLDVRKTISRLTKVAKI